MTAMLLSKQIQVSGVTSVTAEAIGYNGVIVRSHRTCQRRGFCVGGMFLVSQTG
jgi:hypothetical protein